MTYILTVKRRGKLRMKQVLGKVDSDINRLIVVAKGAMKPRKKCAKMRKVEASITDCFGNSVWSLEI